MLFSDNDTSDISILVNNIISGARPMIPLPKNEVDRSFFNLMKKCWNQKPIKRPNMNVVLKYLKRVFDDLAEFKNKSYQIEPIEEENGIFDIFISLNEGYWAFHFQLFCIRFYKP